MEEERVEEEQYRDTLAEQGLDPEVLCSSAVSTITDVASRNSKGQPAVKKTRQLMSESGLAKAHFTLLDDKRQKCNHCISPQHVFAASTTAPSLKYHLEHHHPVVWKEVLNTARRKKPAVPDHFNPDFFGPKLAASKQTIDKQLMKCIVYSSSPFSLVDSSDFRTFCKMLNYDPVSPNTLKKQIFAEYELQKANIRKILSGVPGRISPTTDMWTSISGAFFLALTSHWISSDWTIRKALLDFVYVGKRHTGVNLSTQILKTLREFGIADKILGIATDEGSNIVACFESSGKLLDLLKTERVKAGKSSWVPETRVICLAHGLNLSAKDGIALQNDVIDRLRELTITLKRPRAKEDFRERLKRPDSRLKLDVRTRWNSTYQMCVSALEIRPELDEYMHSSTSQLQELHLKDEKWDIIRALVALMEHYQSATNDFSASDHLTIHLALPTLRFLQRHLELISKKSDVDWVRAAATAMKRQLTTVQNSWLKKDLAIVAEVLNPAFKDRGLEGQANLKAQTTLRQVFERYAVNAGSATNSLQKAESGYGSIWALMLEESAVGGDATVDEVTEYLAIAPTRGVPILDFRKHAIRFPTLSRMAIDTLAVPVSSVQSERENSKARNIITASRNRLSGPAAQAMMCLKSWNVLLEVVMLVD